MVWTCAGCNEFLYVPRDWEQHGSLPWLSFLCTWCEVWSLGQVAQGNSTSFVRSAWLPLTLLGRRQGPAQPQWPVCSAFTEHCSQLDEPASPPHLGCTWHTDWPSHTRDRGCHQEPWASCCHSTNREGGGLFQPQGGRWALAGALVDSWVPKDLKELTPGPLWEGNQTSVEDPTEMGLEGPGQKIHIQKV